MSRWNGMAFQDGKTVLHNTVTVDMPPYISQSHRMHNPDSELSCKPGSLLLIIMLSLLYAAHHEEAEVPCTKREGLLENTVFSDKFSINLKLFLK